MTSAARGGQLAFSSCPAFPCLGQSPSSDLCSFPGTRYFSFVPVGGLLALSSCPAFPGLGQSPSSDLCSFLHPPSPEHSRLQQASMRPTASTCYFRRTAAVFLITTLFVSFIVRSRAPTLGVLAIYFTNIPHVPSLCLLVKPI